MGDYSTIKQANIAHLNIEGHLGDKAGALHGVLVVGLDVPHLDELVEHALRVLHRPVAVNPSVHVHVLRLFQPRI
jgi:hypothetical protein